MPEGYSYEIRENAKELFVTEGRTYDQVAGSTGVSVAQLKRWGKDEDWTGARKEYREALSSIKRDTVMLRAKLLKTALGSGDPQSVYAFAAIEKAVIAGKNKETVQESVPEIPARQFNDPTEAIDALWEALQSAVSNMIASPHTMDFKKLKHLKDAFGLLSDMKSQHSKKTVGPKKVKELDDTAIQTIKDIYGIS